MYETLDIPNSFRIDTSPYTNRPFFVTSFDWTALITKGSIPTLSSTLSLPGDVIRSNPSLLSAMKIGSLYRSDLTLQISIAGTIAHAGCLLVGVLPPLNVLPSLLLDYTPLINTVLSGPHAFLFANEATSISIDVPWYSPSDLGSFDFETLSASYRPAPDLYSITGNYSTLVFIVLSPLSPSTSASDTLSVTIDASFRHLDVFVPTPRYVAYTTSAQSGLLDTLKTSVSAALDGGASYLKTTAGDFVDCARQAFRDYTGLHNPSDGGIFHRVINTHRNFPNTVDGTQFFESLDPNPNVNRIVDGPLFHSNVDEMSLSHIISKKQYIGQFKVTTAFSVGALLWSRPISPFQGGLSPLDLQIANNIELLHRLSRAWKGSIRLTFQSVINNKQQMKLRVLSLYNPSTSILAGFPTYQSILNAPSHLMEFTAGGQSHEVVLPYLCRNALTPCSRSMSAESLFHGQYYVYLASKFANSDDSPTTVYFNVYISLEPDFSFYGYSTEIQRFTTPYRIPLPTPVVGDSAFPTDDVNEDVIIASIQGLEVMNEPQDQTDILSVRKNVKASDFLRIMPIPDIRPLIRRMYPYVVSTVEIPISSSVQIVTPLAPITGTNMGNSTNFFSGSPCQILGGMYFGRDAGIKFSYTVKPYFVTGSRDFGDPKNYFAFEASFVPPNYFVGNNGIIFSSAIDVANKGLNKYANASPMFPIPYTTLQQGSNLIFEFTVPNTSIAKFISTPNMLSGDTGSIRDTFSSNMGGVVCYFTNLCGQEGAVLNVDVVISMAVTDESRLGFHCIAPYVATYYQTPPAGTAPNLQNTLYMGDVASAVTAPSIIRSSFLYYNS